MPAVIVAEFDRVLGALLELRHNPGGDGRPVPVDVGLDPEAHKVWREFYNRFAQRQADTHDGSGGGATHTGQARS